MRPQRDYRSTSKATYKEFIKQHPDTDISFEDYKNIIVGYNTSIMEHLLNTGDRITFPWGIGSLGVVKYRRNITETTLDKSGYGSIINWPETKKQGKTIYYLNLHTSGFTYAYAWPSMFTHIKFKGIWRLEIWRVYKRKLSKKLMDPEFIYNDIYRVLGKRRHFKQ